MIIGIAGPYSSPTEAGRAENLRLLNEAAARLLERGHVPLIGVNAALPVIQQARLENPYEGIMAISMAVIDRCEALLLLAESPGANRERDFILSKGLPVYYRIEDVPSEIPT